MNVILKEKKVFDKELIVEEAQISDGNEKPYTKLRLTREDAVAVLLFNTDSEKFILTRQFRYAISSRIKENILEIVAGKIDRGEEPIETAIREVKEETGYKITKNRTRLLVSCFSSPGYSSECFYIYFATITNNDKTSAGGGLKDQNEEIEIVEINFNDFRSMIKKCEIQDAKTYLAGLLYSR